MDSTVQLFLSFSCYSFICYIRGTTVLILILIVIKTWLFHPAVVAVVKQSTEHLHIDYESHFPSGCSKSNFCEDECIIVIFLSNI